MTRIRQIFNPSTLKAAYTAGTNKAQVVDLDVSGDPCGCGPTPKFVDITLSGVTACGCYNSAFLSTKLSGSPDGTYRLCYYGKDGDVCTWSHYTCSLSNIILTAEHWDDEDCPGEPDYLDDVAAGLSLDLDTVASEVTVMFSSNTWPRSGGNAIYFCGTAAVESGCVDAVVSNEYAIGNCDDYPATCIGVGEYMVRAHSGTATIVAH